MENWENNIEDEYQRRFEDFEEMPPDFLWDKIQPRIQEEKKRRGLVVWWPMGIAAALLIAFTLGYNYLSSTQKIEVASRFEKPNKINSGTSVADTKQSEAIEETSTNGTKTDFNFNNSLANNEQVSNRNEWRNSSINDPIVRVVNDDLRSKINQIRSSTNEIVTEKSITSNIENTTIVSERKNLQTTLAEIASIDKIKIYNSLNTNSLGISQPEKESIIETSDEKVLAFIPPKEVFANISPMLNYYVISPNRNDNFLVKAFNGSEQRLGFAAQMGVVYQLNKRLSSRNALSYFTGKSKISYDVLHNEPQSITILNDHSVQINNSDLSHNEFKKWQYVELQSDLLYEIKKMQALSVGVKVGFQTEKLNKPAIYARLGYRLSKPISNKIALWAEPSVALSLTSQSSVENLFAYRTTGFSLNIGASWLR